MENTLKFNAGRYKVPVIVTYTSERIIFKCKYNKNLIEEFKVMQGARWHPENKTWSAVNSIRNHFQILFLQGNDPYYNYRQPLGPLMEQIRPTLTRPLYEHQIEMTAHMMQCHYVIEACEMGTGKTLSFIEAIERAKLLDKDVWYVGPKSGVVAVRREFQKWESKAQPLYFTYEGLVKKMKDPDSYIPQCVCFDESSRVKSPTAQRSQAAFDLSMKIRDKYKGSGYVILMSGTPSPRVPIDWYQQAEIACPGYLREGDINKFKRRLCLIEERESAAGGVYPHIVTWLNDENKCAICGSFKAEPVHNELLFDGSKKHAFVPSVNQVGYLYKRLAGLVLVKFKKDCLDLPEKRYEIRRIKPTVTTLRLAQIIVKTGGRAIEVLTKLRELSDGFQYKETKVGMQICPTCEGTKSIRSPIVPETSDDDSEYKDIALPSDVPTQTITDWQIIPCPKCGAQGEIPRYERSAEEVSTPKDAALVEILEAHEETGRIVIWGGFTESIDRIVRLCTKYGWSTLRVDGRGYRTNDVLGNTVDTMEFLNCLDFSNPAYVELLEKFPKIAFVGHPRAGGMALTLTASPTELFYSNDFNGEARFQAEDRFHRAGMDKNRGATIIDFVHLPSDQLVLDNLQKKKDLQALTMGELAEAIEKGV